MKLKNALFALLIGYVAFTQAQVGKSVFGKDPDNQLSALYKAEYNRKAEIKLDGKKYRIYNNYVTFGIGKGYNSIWNQGFVTTGIDFNFHLGKTYFQAGGYVQGPGFYNKEQVQLHLAGGYRKESYQYFWAAFGGISYSNGYYPVMVNGIVHQDSTVYPIMSQVGAYAALQMFYKLKFDYGIGLTVFGDVNSKQYMVGARIELFFSGAYRGTVIHKDEE